MECTTNWPAEASPGTGFGERPRRNAGPALMRHADIAPVAIDGRHAVQAHARTTQSLAVLRDARFDGRESRPARIVCPLCVTETPRANSVSVSLDEGELLVCAACALAGLDRVPHPGVHRGWLK